MRIRYLTNSKPKSSGPRTKNAVDNAGADNQLRLQLARDRFEVGGVALVECIWEVL